MDAVVLYNPELVEFGKNNEELPITPQAKPEKPNFALDDNLEQSEGKNTSMILEQTKKVLKYSLADYDNILNAKPSTDLEEINKQITDEINYLTKRVPSQLDQVLFCIEGLIYRDSWNKEDFGEYKLIYEKAKKLEGWDKASKLAELRMCLMWAIPQEEYYQEPEVVDPMFGSGNRAIEAE